MTDVQHNSSAFMEILEEVTSAAVIMIAHGFFVLIIIGTIYVTGSALALTQHGEHEATLEPCPAALRRVSGLQH